jgi:hypothetical protein
MVNENNYNKKQRIFGSLDTRTYVENKCPTILFSFEVSVRVARFF